MSDPTVHVTFEGGLDMDAAEVWPDGIPEEVTALAVAEVMRESGTMTDVLREWCLNQGLTVVVTVGRDSVEVWS
jgi:hypothetical protein